MLLIDVTLNAFFYIYFFSFFYYFLISAVDSAVSDRHRNSYELILNVLARTDTLRTVPSGESSAPWTSDDRWALDVSPEFSRLFIFIASKCCRTGVLKFTSSVYDRITRRTTTP